MLNVQQWLLNNNKDFNLLEQQFGIKSTFHEDGRVILNYSQIDSDKRNPIVRECRGLVLNSHHPEHLVARAFQRFFNFGEYPEEHNQFDWNDCITYHKEDGSLILTYKWNGNYHLNTRGSFGAGEIVKDVITWRECFDKAVPRWEERQCYHTEWRPITLVWELCSKYNKVVRDYKEPTAYLLSAFDCKEELSDNEVDNLAKEMKVARPSKTLCKSIDEAQSYIKRIVDSDMTFEGVVVRDSLNRRFKVKSDKYLALHRLANNGNLLSNLSYARANLIPLILQGEIDEVVCYFPELKPLAEELENKIKSIKNNINIVWNENKNISSQKIFAQNIAKYSFKSILFAARKSGNEPLKLLNSEFLVKLFA